MITIKSYTNIEQSRKLAKILPFETADMYYNLGESKYPNVIYGSYDDFKCYTPCWSLAALLDIFKTNVGLAKDYDLWFCYDNGKSYCTRHYANAIDACVAMIEKLHELKML